MFKVRMMVLGDVVLAVLMIVLGGIVFAESFNLPEPALEPVGPAAFPFAVSVLLIALATVVLWRAIMLSAGIVELSSHRKRVDLALLMLALTVGYFLALQFSLLTFRWATVAYAFVLTAALFDWQPRRLPAAIIIALVLGVGLKFMFTEVLYLDLP